MSIDAILLLTSVKLLDSRVDVTSDLPHTVYVWRDGGAAEPRTEAFLWCLTVHIVSTEEETKRHEE